MRKIKGYDQFLEAGGIITEFPPEASDPSKFEYVRITKGVTKCGQRYTVKTSEYEKPRIPKGEALSNRINLASQDWSNIAPGDPKNRITAELIHASLAGRFREHEEKFMLYVWTGEKRYRSAAWALLMTRLSSDCVRGSWDIRKRGILTAMANTALLNFMRPVDYQNLSGREWARNLELSCDKDWSKRWRARYNSLMEYGTIILENGREQIARNF